jgi:hypothetical protein
MRQHRRLVAFRQAPPGGEGAQEVEIFSAEGWWKRPGDEILRTCIERFNTLR